MSVVTVTVVFGSLELLALHIAALKNQTYPVTSIFVIASETDLRYARENDLLAVYARGIHFGSKFQRGFDFARRFCPDAVLFLSPDEILSSNWIEEGIKRIKKGYDIVGTNNRRLIDNDNIYRVNVNGDALHLGQGQLISKRLFGKLKFPVKFADSCRNFGRKLDIGLMSKFRGRKRVLLNCIFTILIKDTARRENAVHQLLSSERVIIEMIEDPLVAIGELFNDGDIEEIVELL